MGFFGPKSYISITYVSITQMQTMSGQSLDFDEELIPY